MTNGEATAEIRLKLYLGNPYILTIVKQGLRYTEAALSDHINQIFASRKLTFEDPIGREQTLHECQIFLDQIQEIKITSKEISDLLDLYWEKYIDVD